MRDRQISQRERTEVHLENEGIPFEALARRAHPGTQHARMSGSLVVRMVLHMLHGLDVDQAAEQQEAEAQADRDRPAD